MESIDEVILFCSSVSPASRPVIQVIQQYQLPVTIVRLDTLESREAAKNGPYFQIKNVPTLVVTYRDGNLQLFVGQPKTLEWLKMSMNPQRAPQNLHGESPISLEPKSSKYRERETKISLSSSDEDLELDPPPKKGKKPKKKTKTSPPKSKKSNIKEGGLYGPSKSKKKKKTSVEFYSSDENDGGGEVDIEFVDDGRPPAPPTGGLMVGAQAVRPQRMKGSSLAEMAKQMEQDREKTLPWMTDKNVPVYN